jgi:signal transduction histidine kinase
MPIRQVQISPMVDDTESELSALQRDELIERARALQTVLRVAAVVTSARSLEELADRFVQAVAAYTRFPSVVVWRFAPQKAAFELLAQRGFDTTKIPTKALPAKGSLTGLAAERGRVLTSEDIAGDDRVDPDMRVALTENAYTSGACVPIQHEGEVLGSFNLVYPRGTALRKSERQLLETLAATLGMAMAQRIAAEREQTLEVQARRAQQLDSLGVLAGGIAHDFNNLLTGIVGSVDMARALAADVHGTEIVELLQDALSAAARATALVKQLLTFSQGGAPTRRVVDDLGDLIRQVAAFTARGTSVRCEVEIANPLGAVEVDVGQIAQVVQNLVLNACQASRSGASVLVRARREAARDDGAWVVIDVIDTGSGIAPEHLPRIFEPFFTARPGGTGLGLAVSHSIVQRHAGRLTVKSELERGTTFTVELPASERPRSTELPTSSPPSKLSGRALVMDDEDTVRRVLTMLLKQIGFEVQMAAHGEAALELAARAAAEHRPFQLALLDLTIVGGRGAAEIANELRRSSPGIRLVLSTGYAHQGAGDTWDAVLHKPYTIADLSAVVERALAGGECSKP